jgi:hypothetical protein
VQGFDYTALHWADKRKPLQEVAGEFGVFPQAIESPPLVPEEIDQEAPLPAEEVALEGEEVTCVEEVAWVERVTVSEHFMAVEPVPVCAPERPTEPGQRAPEIAA